MQVLYGSEPPTLVVGSKIMLREDFDILDPCLLNMLDPTLLDVYHFGKTRAVVRC